MRNRSSTHGTSWTFAASGPAQGFRADLLWSNTSFTSTLSSSHGYCAQSAACSASKLKHGAWCLVWRSLWACSSSTPKPLLKGTFALSAVHFYPTFRTLLSGGPGARRIGCGTWICASPHLRLPLCLQTWALCTAVGAPPLASGTRVKRSSRDRARCGAAQFAYPAALCNGFVNTFSIRIRTVGNNFATRLGGRRRRSSSTFVLQHGISTPS